MSRCLAVLSRLLVPVIISAVSRTQCGQTEEGVTEGSRCHGAHTLTAGLHFSTAANTASRFILLSLFPFLIVSSFFLIFGVNEAKQRWKSVESNEFKYWRKKIIQDDFWFVGFITDSHGGLVVGLLLLLLPLLYLPLPPISSQLPQWDDE